MDPNLASLVIFVLKLAGTLLALFCLLTSFVFVSEKTFVTTTWFGSKFARVLRPGVNIKFPFPIETTDVRMSTKIQPLEVKVTGQTSDNARITINSSVHFRPLDGKFYAAAYSLEDPETQMMAFLDNYLRAQIKKKSVQEVFSSTNEFQKDILDRLSHKFQEYGYEIENVLIGEPILSAEMSHAYERKLIAQQQQASAELEGQALKTKLTMKAEAEGEVVTIKAKAFVEGRKIMSDGNVEALKLFLEGLPDDSLTARSVLDFFAGLDEREAVREAAGHGGLTIASFGGRGGQGGSELSQTAAALEAVLARRERKQAEARAAEARAAAAKATESEASPGATG